MSQLSIEARHVVVNAGDGGDTTTQGLGCTYLLMPSNCVYAKGDDQAGRQHGNDHDVVGDVGAVRGPTPMAIVKR